MEFTESVRETRHERGTPQTYINIQFSYMLVSLGRRSSARLERLAVNQLVIGSNPIGGANDFYLPPLPLLLKTMRLSAWTRVPSFLSLLKASLRAPSMLLPILLKPRRRAVSFSRDRSLRPRE